MGQEVQNTDFTDKQFKDFDKNLKEELSLIKTWFDSGEFKKNASKFGVELEGWFVNPNKLPSLKGFETIQKLTHPQVVPEISKFNFEINSTPYHYTEECFSQISKEIQDIFSKLQVTSEEDDCLFIGSLPTLREHMLSLDIMTPYNRYNVMNEQVMKHRDHEPLEIHIEGKEELDLSMDSVIAECAATSLQIHLEVTQEQAARYYNASIAASSFLVAISANSPYFFGKELWDESRIMGFEQAVGLECDSERKGITLDRVTLGSGYVKKSLYELFEENVIDYPVLLPEVKNDAEPKKLEHLRFHNGTIWRWTRPIIGICEKGGKPHLRIEQRAPSSGPTVVDSIANTVFFLGLVDYFVSLEKDVSEYICFNDAKENFYKAAKQSYYCRVHWLDGDEHDMQETLLKKIIPNVEKMLVKRGVDKADIDYFLKDIIHNRVEKGINGATWQKAYIHMHGKRFQELTEAYIRNQKTNKPIHLWSLDK